MNEIQEVSNVTARHLEDIYEKDILKLQNFQSTTENGLSKLREELRQLAENSLSGKPDSASRASIEEFSKALETLKEDGSQLRNSYEILQV